MSEKALSDFEKYYAEFMHLIKEGFSGNLPFDTDYIRKVMCVAPEIRKAFEKADERDWIGYFLKKGAPDFETIRIWMNHRMWGKPESKLKPADTISALGYERGTAEAEKMLIAYASEALKFAPERTDLHEIARLRLPEDLLVLLGDRQMKEDADRARRNERRDGRKGVDPEQDYEQEPPEKITFSIAEMRGKGIIRGIRQDLEAMIDFRDEKKLQEWKRYIETGNANQKAMLAEVASGYVRAVDDSYRRRNQRLNQAAEKAEKAFASLERIAKHESEKTRYFSGIQSAIQDGNPESVADSLKQYLDSAKEAYGESNKYASISRNIDTLRTRKFRKDDTRKKFMYRIKSQIDRYGSSAKHVKDIESAVNTARGMQVFRKETLTTPKGKKEVYRGADGKFRSVKEYADALSGFERVISGYLEEHRIEEQAAEQIEKLERAYQCMPQNPSHRALPADQIRLQRFSYEPVESIPEIQRQIAYNALESHTDRTKAEKDAARLARLIGTDAFYPESTRYCRAHPEMSKVISIRRVLEGKTKLEDALGIKPVKDSEEQNSDDMPVLSAAALLAYTVIASAYSIITR